jgi:hypothetical protein
MEWISIDDRLPKINEYVIAFENDTYCRDIHICKFTGKFWETSDEILKITHWMKLPEYPDDEKIIKDLMLSAQSTANDTVKLDHATN